MKAAKKPYEQLKESWLASMATSVICCRRSASICQLGCDLSGCNLGNNVNEVISGGVAG